jgi:hypothetical protein
MQYEEPGQERENDLRRSLHSLQEFVCELLIQNQELRMSLLGLSNEPPIPGGLTNEYRQFIRNP